MDDTRSVTRSMTSTPTLVTSGSMKKYVKYLYSPPPGSSSTVYLLHELLPFMLPFSPTVLYRRVKYVYKKDDIINSTRTSLLVSGEYFYCKYGVYRVSSYVTGKLQVDCKAVKKFTTKY